jgi:hypothetical protein
VALGWSRGYYRHGRWLSRFVQAAGKLAPRATVSLNTFNTFHRKNTSGRDCESACRKGGYERYASKTFVRCSGEATYFFFDLIRNHSNTSVATL